MPDRGEPLQAGTGIDWTELARILGPRFSTAAATRAHYASGESFPTSMPPDAVAFPVSTEETSLIARFCHERRVPMVASAAGTSLEGQITAPLGGLAVNFSQMDRILDVAAEDLDCHVEAGVTRGALNRHLRDLGLFFPVDPGADASIGGMAATRASGTAAVRYGTMAQNVLGLTVVRADGTVLGTGGRARKSSAGYDLTRLFVGSEGTLGLITEIRLRLSAIPQATVVATCAFGDLAAAVDAVVVLTQAGVGVARVELLDAVQIRACNAYSKLLLPERPHLFLEFHGLEQAVAEQVPIAEAVMRDLGGEGFVHAEAPEDRARLWKARHDAYFAARALKPGGEVWASDVCVPVSALAGVITAVRADIEAHGLLAPIVGHVGDGNFHVLFNMSPERPEERRAAEAVYRRMIDRALAAGGTCSGEHGIGLNKRAYLAGEAGEGAIETMRMIKQALDPRGLMNPGKIFVTPPAA